MHFKVLLSILLVIYGQIVTAQSVPPEAPQSGAQNEAVTPDPSYRLSVGDEIAISVFGEPDLSKAELINRTGQVRLPLVGEIKIAGLTVRDAERLIEQTYITEEYLKAPQVAIRMTGYAVREVLVNGAVRSPGAYRFPLDSVSIDIRDLISRLGGLLPVARGDSVTVTTRTEQGTERVRTVNLDRLLSGRDTNADTLIYPGDRVFIPERLF